MKKLIASSLGLVLILLSTAVFADRVFQTAEMLAGPDSNKPMESPQGAAWLRRSPDRVDGRIMVKVDQANTAYSIWFIAFNHPENCAGQPCGFGDLAFNKDAVGGAVFNASGAISAADGELKKNGKPAGGGVINVDIDVVAGEGSDIGGLEIGHASFPLLPADFCELIGCVFDDFNGVLELENGLCAEIHFDVNQHDVFDEGWVTELTQPEGMAHRFAIFPAVLPPEDCVDP